LLRGHPEFPEQALNGGFEMVTTKKARRPISLGQANRTSKKRLSKIKATFTPNTVFLIMPFKGTDSALAAIEDECQKLQLQATRADQDTDSGSIIQEILEHIDEAQFIICDLTHGRPNVYYELGYAHGGGNFPDNILLLAKRKTVPAFDVQSLRRMEYGSIKELRSIVSARLIEWKQMSKSQPRRSSKNG
jgi:hypothetical protein